MGIHIRSRFAKMGLATAALAGCLAFAAAPIARADDDDCQRKIAKIDHKLHEAIEDHGPNSRQAEHWRHELHEQREACWSREHKWWDEDSRRWHNDHDWDDNDHHWEHEH